PVATLRAVIRSMCCSSWRRPRRSFFPLTHPATTAIYTLSLHDALPICAGPLHVAAGRGAGVDGPPLLQRECDLVYVLGEAEFGADRKSTRLNSSHVAISYAVFCLKKKILALQDGTPPIYRVQRHADAAH